MNLVWDRINLRKVIAHRVEPVEGLVGAVNADLIGVADALEALAADLNPQAKSAAS